MGWAGQSTPTKVISWIFQAKREWPSANSKEIKLKGLTSNTMEVLWMRTKEFLLRPYTKQKHYHPNDKCSYSGTWCKKKTKSHHFLPKCHLLKFDIRRSPYNQSTLPSWKTDTYPLQFGTLESMMISFSAGRIISGLATLFAICFKMDAWKIPLKSSCSHQRCI